MKRRSFFGIVSGLFAGCMLPWKAPSETWLTVEEAKVMGPFKHDDCGNVIGGYPHSMSGWQSPWVESNEQ